MAHIPFNRPAQIGREFEYMQAALDAGQISGNGPFTRRVEALLEAELGVPRVMLTTSCTHALEMAMLLADLQPGDEVLAPAFTFVTTVSAFVLRGARPVFIDIRPDTLNLDERQVEAALTPRTRAIVPVHYGGVSCQMDVLLDIAVRHNLLVIEDNAHGLFGRFRGRYLGTFGALATQSFHETKNFSCGEGGALLINDPALIARAEIIREKGTNRSQFYRGEVDRYTWVDIGSSYVLSDILAAYLLAQFEQREFIQTRRQELWERYLAAFADFPMREWAQLPFTPLDCESAYHLFYLLLPSLDVRTALIAHLKAQDILAVFHYVPLHLSPMGRRYGYTEADLPVTQDISDRLLRLPFYTTMTDAEQMRVIKAVREFFEAM